MNLMDLHSTSTSRTKDAEVLRQKFNVGFEYPVIFTRNVFDVANPVLVRTIGEGAGSRDPRVAVFVDDGVASAWPSLGRQIAAYGAAHQSIFELVGGSTVLPGGEAAKSDLIWVERIHRRLDLAGIDRHSYVIAIGGGAVLDLVGYASATFHRGVRLIRMPTTVLAQDDAGVGVKNGVNQFGKKNLIGTFHVPHAVVNDSDFLRSLSRRDAIAGMAEAVKVALVRDGDFFEWIETNAEALRRLDASSLEGLIRRSAELHLEHICGNGDPFEAGSARPLDYGHWAAHKLESLAGYKVRHGEAVAISMMIDARYSVLAGLQEKGGEYRLLALLRRLGFNLWHPALDVRKRDGRRIIIDGLQEFREHLGGALSVTHIRKPGCPVEVGSMDASLIDQSVEWLRSEEGGA